MLDAALVEDPSEVLTFFDYPTSFQLKHTGYSDFTQVKLCHYIFFYFIDVKHLECE